MLLFVPLLLLYASSYFQRTAVPGTIFSQLQADLGLNAFQITRFRNWLSVCLQTNTAARVSLLPEEFFSAPARSFFLCWTISADCISAVCLPDSEPAQCI